MKSFSSLPMLLIVSLVLFVASKVNSAPQIEPNEPITVSTWFGDIEGTALSTKESKEKQMKTGWSAHSCSIGYLRKTGKTMIFSPVFTLPTLQNDHYVVTFKNGSINVSAKSNGRHVASLNLENIAPGSIIQIKEEKEKINRLDSDKVLPRLKKVLQNNPSFDELTKIIGKPDRNIGSGIDVLIYEFKKGDSIRVGTIHKRSSQKKAILYVDHGKTRIFPTPKPKN